VTLYADSSALLKRYVHEPDSEAAEQLLRTDPVLLTGRHTMVEVRRNLARLLSGSDLARARSAFARDMAVMSVVELDATTCEAAATIAEALGTRTLDALHLGAARRVGSGSGVSFLTYDVRQAQAARSLGFTVLGA